MTPSQQGLPSMCHSPQPHTKVLIPFPYTGKDRTKNLARDRYKMTAQKSVSSVCWEKSRELLHGEEKC